MKVGDIIRVKRTDQLAEVVEVNEKFKHCWVRFFEDFEDEVEAGDEGTFLFDEVEVA